MSKCKDCKYVDNCLWIRGAKFICELCERDCDNCPGCSLKNNICNFIPRLEEDESNAEEVYKFVQSIPAVEYDIIPIENGYIDVFKFEELEYRVKVVCLNGNKSISISINRF